jgi:hypothetical protein
MDDGTFDLGNDQACTAQSAIVMTIKPNRHNVGAKVSKQCDSAAKPGGDLGRDPRFL